MSRQIGTLYTTPDKLNGLQVTIEEYADPTYKRIINGSLDEYQGYANYKDIYDSRQGSYVGGIILCDAAGYEVASEHYKLSDFIWSGNVGTNSMEEIRWWMI